MMYEMYQAQMDALGPARFLADTAAAWLRPFNGTGIESFLPRATTAALDVMAGVSLTHQRPPFGIDTVLVGGKPVAVQEDIVLETPFAKLLHFRKTSGPAQPALLVVAPMSGHFATLLRGTVRTLLADHDVYITDWVNARDIPLAAGRFDLDDSIAHIIMFLEYLGQDAHVLAVCQPAVPVLAAVALMAQDGNAAQPRSMTLMGGPIDTRVAPTEVNALAQKHPIEWFARNMVSAVPSRYTGGGRVVYPGFLQLMAFVAMNPDRHMRAHFDQFLNLVHGDGESVAAHRRFYDEYLAVMDLAGEFYLDTIQKVFQEHHLPRGILTWRNNLVTPEAITRTALFTVEGELDDICAVGQTNVALALCSSLPDSRKHAHMQVGVGHYGVFNGRRWNADIYPRVQEFIAAA